MTLQDWITSSGRYPERAASPELTPDVAANAQKLVNAVNALLAELGWSQAVSISSGFRPAAVNAATPGAAKKSAHSTGLAVDIMQPKGHNELGLLIRKHQGNQGASGLLGRHGLMMESLEATIGTNTTWVHLDLVARSPRPSCEFKP